MSRQEPMTAYEAALLEQRVAFLEEVVRKYVLTGHRQFEDYFEDWKQQRGAFELRR